MKLASHTHILLQIAVVLCCSQCGAATIIAKSTVNECFNYGQPELLNSNGDSCGKKLVIALTVSGNEGKAQHLEANVARVTDGTSNKPKNLQLQNPVKIQIHKSPVLINYRLYQVGYVNHRPYEEVVTKKGRRCRHDWYSHDYEAACGFVYSTDTKERIFDSQGFCCGCKMGGKRYDRGESVNCLKSKDTAHCLRFHPLYYYVFGLYPPQLAFNITIEIKHMTYKTNDGEDVWETLSKFDIGPHRTIARSDNVQLKAEYIADFYPSDFMDAGKLAHKYVLIPDTTSKENKGKTTNAPIWKSIDNASEWMAVTKHHFDFTGWSCNKIGVSYSRFRNQGSRCLTPRGSCLQNQPHHMWLRDRKKQAEGRKGEYMLHNFGKVHSLPHSNGMTDFQLNFVATSRRNSLIVISMVADDLKTVVNTSPGRLVEAYIDPFESLSVDGLLMVIVQNTGIVTATYQLFALHCSAGIDWVPSETLTIDPSAIVNISFTMHSFHSIGQINHCQVELYNQNSELLDNMTVYFETLDTCFCYGYCGCSCGDNVTDCPPPPEYHEADVLRELNFRFLNKITNFLKGNAGKFLLGTWFIFVLMLLGCCKVLHMLLTGQVDYPALTNPAKLALKVTNKIFGKWCPMFWGKCGDCCQRYCLCLCATAATAVTGQKDYTAQAHDLRSGWRRPRQCDGMCSGAKQARKAHRKQMRINKRKGLKSDTAWFQKRYTCTCKVRDTKPCLEICKGIFFFIYCPLLPLWWVLDFVCEHIKRKWRRHRRKKRFRALKEAEKAKKENTYLMLDQYTRGKVEKQIIDFNKETKAKRKKKLKKEKKAEDTKEDEVPVSSQESSDTTDIDEAGDVEELLNPGYPVYFNYAYVPPGKPPPSLMNPGKSFSIKGRLTEMEGSGYTFNLYKYTVQVKQEVTGKTRVLQPPTELDPAHFTRLVDKNVALKLITLTPLFNCLNDAPKQ